MVLPGRALAVGIACWFEAGIAGKREISVNLSRVGVERTAASRGLAALERAGLVQVERRPGRKPLVRVIGT